MGLLVYHPRFFKYVCPGYLQRKLDNSIIGGSKCGVSSVTECSFYLSR